jgi:hypothetical protein
VVSKPPHLKGGVVGVIYNPDRNHRINCNRPSKFLHRKFNIYNFNI